MSKVDEKSISEKMVQLGELVAWFESEDFSIEQAIEKFTAAEKLASEIESDLSDFKNKITVIKQKFDEA